jgi:hypothetical protein
MYARLARGLEIDHRVFIYETPDPKFLWDVKGILTDFDLPMGNGYEFSRAAREQGFKGRIAVVSGRPQEHLPVELGDYVNEVHQKPISIDKIEELMRRLMSDLPA